MRIREIKGTIQASLVEAMVVLKRTTWRRPVTTEQPESTKAILEGRVSPDRPWPTKDQWKARPTGTYVEQEEDVLVGRRAISLEELIPFKANQMRKGIESPGQPDLGLTDEKRERAAEAFMQAAGSGKRWPQLTEAEKKRVKNYFLDSMLGRVATAEEVRAFYEVPDKADLLIQQALAEEKA